MIVMYRHLWSYIRVILNNHMINSQSWNAFNESQLDTWKTLVVNLKCPNHVDVEVSYRDVRLHKLM